MNCTSLSLYASSVRVICINNKHLSVYKTGDKFVFPHYIVWCITCMVVNVYIPPWWSHVYSPRWSRVYPPSNLSNRVIHENTSMRLCLIYHTTLYVKLLYLYQKQYNSCKYLQCRGSAWFDKSCFLWRRVRLFPGMLESYMERSY